MCAGCSIQLIHAAVCRPSKGGTGGPTCSAMCEYRPACQPARRLRPGTCRDPPCSRPWPAASLPAPSLIHPCWRVPATCSVNVTLGPREDRMLITGLHTVCDIYCITCNCVLGWKYEVRACMRKGAGGRRSSEPCSTGRQLACHQGSPRFATATPCPTNDWVSCRWHTRRARSTRRESSSWKR